MGEKLIPEMCSRIENEFSISDKIFSAMISRSSRNKTEKAADQDESVLILSQGGSFTTVLKIISSLSD